MPRVVITGIGTVSPNGIGNKNFTEALLRGRSGIRRIQSFDPEGLSSQIGGEVFLDGEGNGKLPRILKLALAASQEALEESGIESKKLSEEEKGKIGVVLGTGGAGIEFTEKQYELKKPHVYAISQSTPGNLSSELSITFGFQGLSHVISTGCTSSTDAIGYAFHEIQSGRLNRALAGGADSCFTWNIMKAFSFMKVLSTHWNDSPEKASRPFSADRDGFVLGEGAWMFVLEEYEEAQKRDALIYAEILGYGSSCEAFHPVRLEDNGRGSFRAMTQALEEARVNREAIDYVNLHGTSTPLGDRVETEAMKTFFGTRVRQIPMSATKSMIGHPQGASGAAGLAATLLCLKEDLLHPTINLHRPDPDCDLDYIPNETRQAKVKTFLVNTLGFGSKNSALVLRTL